MLGYLILLLPIYLGALLPINSLHEENSQKVNLFEVRPLRGGMVRDRLVFHQEISSENKESASELGNIKGIII